MQLVLSSITPLTADVSTFSFLPPENTVWIAGQSIRLELPSGEERRFSISSPPSDKKLAITTRKSQSFFKQELWNLKVGDTVQGFNIEGSFTWQPQAITHTLIAGGMGITPYMAMLRDQINTLHKIDLWYTTSDSYPLFREELTSLVERFPTFSFHIERPLPLDHIMENKLSDTFYYLSGPQDFVNETVDKLMKDYAIASRFIIKDLFTGNIFT